MFGLGNTNTIITERESVEDKKRLYELERQRKQDNLRDRRIAGKVGPLVSATLQLGMRLMT